MLIETLDDLLHDAGYGHTVELTDAIATTVPADDDVPGTAITNIEVARLRRAVRDLPSFDAWLLNRRYGLRGQPALSIRDLATRLNTTHTTVRRMERRALDRLRDIYSEEIAA